VFLLSLYFGLTTRL